MSANRLLGLRLQNYYIFLICARGREKNIKNSRKVRGKYWMVSEWYRNGIEVVTRKKAERCRQEAGVCNQQVKSSIIWVASTISTKKAHCGMRFLSMNYE